MKGRIFLFALFASESVFAAMASHNTSHDTGSDYIDTIRIIFIFACVIGIIIYEVRQSKKRKKRRERNKALGAMPMHHDRTEEDNDDDNNDDSDLDSDSDPDFDFDFDD